MGLAIETRQIATWTCDRCGKVEQAETKQGDLTFSMKDPVGWKALFVSVPYLTAFKGRAPTAFQTIGVERKDIWMLPVMELSDGTAFLLCRTCVPISLPFLSVEQQRA